MKKCENNVKIEESHVFHIFFILFSYYFHILGPRTRAQAPKRRRGGQALAGTAAALVPQNVKII